MHVFRAHQQVQAPAQSRQSRRRQATRLCSRIWPLRSSKCYHLYCLTHYVLLVALEKNCSPQKYILRTELTLSWGHGNGIEEWCRSIIASCSCWALVFYAPTSSLSRQFCIWHVFHPMDRGQLRLISSTKILSLLEKHPTTLQFHCRHNWDWTWFRTFDWVLQRFVPSRWYSKVQGTRKRWLHRLSRRFYYYFVYQGDA